MNSAYRFATAIIILSIVVVIGCRKEDETPVYRYYGPATTTNTEDADQQGALAAAGQGTRVNYSAINVACPIPKGIKGFVTSDTDLDEFWMNNCPASATGPDIDFDQQFMAYYSTQLSGCAAMRIKMVGMVDDKLVVGLEKLMPPATCNCTADPYNWRAFLAIDQVEDTTPKFVIFAGDRDCAPVQ